MRGTFMSKRVVLGAAAAILMGGIGACYPGSINDVGEADLVITAYDTAFDFGPVGTFFMPDTIIRVGDDDEEDIDRTFDAEILAKVAQELIDLGYTRLDEGAGVAPDVFVALGTSTSSFGWWVPGGCYWCYYPGYPGWGPGWGGYPPYYPWYPGYGGGYGGTYETGSLGIVMVDANVAGVEVPAVWGGVINGLLSSSNANTASRVLRQIEQVFEQSPYLAN